MAMYRLGPPGPNQGFLRVILRLLVRISPRFLADLTCGPCPLDGDRKREPPVTSPLEGLARPTVEGSPADSHSGSLPRCSHQPFTAVLVFQRYERLVRPSSDCHGCACLPQPKSGPGRQTGSPRIIFSTPCGNMSTPSRWTRRRQFQRPGSDIRDVRLEVRLGNASDRLPAGGLHSGDAEVG